MPAQPDSTRDGFGQEFVITREIAAARELVFCAWTDPQRVAQWWGPRGFTNPVCQWDARPGQTIHVVMRAPNGADFPMGGAFREVVAPERLVFTSGALDEQGAMLFEFLHTVTFTEQLGRTTLTVRSKVIRTTPGAGRYIGGFEAGMTQSLERLSALADPTNGREIVHTRVVGAPRELVWQAWTDPQHVVRWWGPRGFSTTIKRMDFRVGGVWEHLMRGPDGATYPNQSTFKEIVPLERIVYSHGGGRDGGPGASFTATWTFETVEGGKTRVTGRLLFPSAEARDFVAREFGAVEGGRQTLARLAEHLPTLQMREFVLTRELAAPRQLVWEAWTRAEHVQQWFGPKGFTMPVCALDFRPGGEFHYGMKSPDGHEMWGKWTFLEIVPPEKLVVLVSFSDANRGVTRHPMSATWPLETLSTTTFTEHDGKTTLTLRWVAFNATETERQTFDGAHEGMKQGWAGTMAQFEAYLATVQGG